MLFRRHFTGWEKMTNDCNPHVFKTPSPLYLLFPLPRIPFVMGSVWRASVSLLDSGNVSFRFIFLGKVLQKLHLSNARLLKALITIHPPGQFTCLFSTIKRSLRSMTMLLMLCWVTGLKSTQLFYTPNTKTTFDIASPSRYSSVTSHLIVTKLLETSPYLFFLPIYSLTHNNLDFCSWNNFCWNCSEISIELISVLFPGHSLPYLTWLSWSFKTGPPNCKDFEWKDLPY